MPKETEKQNTINTENIFDEFVESQENSWEIDASIKNTRGIYDYLQGVNYVLMFLNICLFFIIVIFSFYNYFQAKEEKTNIAFLKPVCWFLLGDVYSSGQDCNSVSSVLPEYQEQIRELQDDIGGSLTDLMVDIYSMNNFSYSKKVSFLLDATHGRMKPLTILKDFDTIKTEFTSSFERSNVSCKNLTISEWNILSISCDVFSSDWDTSIIDIRNGVRSTLPGWWTSISRASSFINFIENHDSKSFSIVEKPWELNSSQTSDGWPYTQVTSIDLILEYNNTEYLPF